MKQKTIGIINYGVGNLQSVKNSLDHLHIPNIIVNKPNEIDKCAKIILPGVGAFNPAITKLDKLLFSKRIKEFAKKQRPILGICLGMQLLFQESTEHGRHKGLGLVKGKVLPFSAKVKKLPLHLIGWNTIIKQRNSAILEGIEDNSSFYFVHGFYCQPTEESVTIASSDYGIKFSAIVQYKNIFGCQFHPEKSQASGLKILENFHNL